MNAEWSGVGPEPVDVLLHRLDEGMPIPSCAHPGDAGVDLCSRIDLELAPSSRALVPTGLSIALPDGFVALVHPRSGLAIKHGVTSLNAPGTIDAGYRGEIAVILFNSDVTEPFMVRRGDRIAQLVVQRFARPVFVEVERLPGSVRDTGGFGSTGVAHLDR